MGKLIVSKRLVSFEEIEVAGGIVEAQLVVPARSVALAHIREARGESGRAAAAAADRDAAFSEGRILSWNLQDDSGRDLDPAVAIDREFAFDHLPGLARELALRLLQLALGDRAALEKKSSPPSCADGGDARP